MANRWTKGEWISGLARWEVDRTVYYSIAFTWKLDEAFSMALFDKALGKRVVAGGPALFLTKMSHEIATVAEVGSVFGYPDAVSRHNPMATEFSFGCDVGCSHCIVPAMHGRKFTLVPDAPVRPILCDNNLSALDPKFQDHIIGRYQREEVPILDANSGFEPRTFTEEVYRRWKPILDASYAPFRFGYDDMADQQYVRPVFKMLRAEPAKRKRVYVMIGNEPYAECMERIYEVIGNGCEPHVQPEIKLVSWEREPWVRHDWTRQRLIDVARWANGWVYRKVPRFEDYDRSNSKRRSEKYNVQDGMFH
jgi:hypothetical protein